MIKRSFKKFFELAPYTRVSAFFVFFLMLQGCSGTGFQNTDPLSKTDRLGIVAYNLASTVDMLQTREIQSNPNYTEVNPLIGDSDTEIAGYFVAKSILHYGITRIIPEKYRTGWLTISIVPSIVAVGNNHSIGVDMKF